MLFGRNKPAPKPDLPVTPPEVIIVVPATSLPIESTDKPFVNFPDISHFEPCDFSKFNVNDMLTKATDGDGFFDGTFIKNMEGCRKSKIRFGAYHFYRCSDDPIVQAKFFIQKVGLENLKSFYYEPILDYETVDPDDHVPHRNNPQSEADMIKNIPNMKKFMAYIEQETGRIPMFYSYESLIQLLKLDASCARWRLWIAKYASTQDPVNYGPWKTYWAHQYSDGEMKNPRWNDNFQGIGRCDANKFKE